MKRLFCVVFCVSVLLVQSRSTLAHSPFKKALQRKYGFKSVSCYACHSRKADISADDLDADGKNKKAFRNAFGIQLSKALEGKNTTKRIAGVKELESDDPKKMKVTKEVTEEFLEALIRVEALKSPSGVTYGELLKKATLDGVKKNTAEE
jgi:hypothetical protein